MQILDELISLLSDDAASLQAALLKAQVLAHKLGDKELALWVGNELRGYPLESDLPPYRSIKLAVMGHVTNGVYHYKNQVLGIQHLKEPFRTNVSTKDARDSVGVIAGWKDSDSLVITIPTEICHFLSEPLSETYFVQQAWGKPSAGAFEQILVQVRSRLLEFCLLIDDKLPKDLTLEQVREKAEELSSNEIFRNAMFGDNVTIVIGSGQISGIKNKVVKNDLASLEKLLSAHGVHESDIADLHSAIAEDGPSRSGLGPEVSTWMGNMLAKAGNGAWDISVSAAGALLAGAIGAFYGLAT